MTKEELAAPELPGAFSLFKPSFEALMNNIGTFLVLFAVIFGTAWLDGLVEGNSAVVLSILSLVVQIMLAPAVTYTLLRSAAGKEVSAIGAVQKGWPFVPRYLGLQILLFVAVAVGLILLIIPGLLAIHRFYLAPYYLLDKNTGIIEALKLSAADAKRFSGAIWGLIGVTVLIAALIFTIILIPVSIVLLVAYLVAPALRYLQIKKAKKAH